MSIDYISDTDDSGQLSGAVDFLQEITIDVIRAIICRCERNENYPFIDTKLSLIDGQDFADDDPVRGRGTIFPWIQGRGLEAFAAHANWLENLGGEYQDDSQRLKKIVSRVLNRMEEIREANDSRLFFMMTSAGRPCRLGASGEIEEFDFDTSAGPNYSDLFYSKGLVAAADLLGDDVKKRRACEWFDKVCEEIFAGKFQSDQQPLDPKNSGAAQVTGRIAHGPFMIAIGGASTFARVTNDKKYAQLGFRLLDHMLDFHVNVDGNNPDIKPFDMWEFIDEEGNLFLTDGKILSDPGHGTEFVGLAVNMLSQFITGKLIKADDNRLEKYYRVLPEILIRNFENGFSPKEYGIVKSFDLLSRTVLNSDMPWWSLPETIRSACLCCNSAGYRESMREIFSKCFNAFKKYYVKPELDMMAIQTLLANGSTGTAIPATPDADPAYHTGMSLIDCIENKINLIG